MARVCQREGCGNRVKQNKDRFCGKECLVADKRDKTREQRAKDALRKMRGCKGCTRIAMRVWLTIHGVPIGLTNPITAARLALAFPDEVREALGTQPVGYAEKFASTMNSTAKSGAKETARPSTSKTATKVSRVAAAVRRAK